MQVIGSTGKRTHLNCVAGIICTIVAIYLKEIGLFTGLALFFLLSSNGTQRWTLKRILDRLEK